MRNESENSEILCSYLLQPKVFHLKDFLPQDKKNQPTT